MASWMRCECGNLIHTNLFSGTKVYLLIRDDEFDALPEPLTSREFIRAARTVLHCSRCGRLAVHWVRGGNPTVYVEEHPKPIEPPIAGPP